jgi:hypothetical protein
MTEIFVRTFVTQATGNDEGMLTVNQLLAKHFIKTQASSDFRFEVKESLFLGSTYEAWPRV